MGQSAKKKVVSRFTWDDYGKRYLKNLNKIYDENKSLLGCRIKLKNY